MEKPMAPITLVSCGDEPVGLTDQRVGVGMSVFGEDAKFANRPVADVGVD